jgi:hypothetical protein
MSTSKLTTGTSTLAALLCRFDARVPSQGRQRAWRCEWHLQSLCSGSVGEHSGATPGGTFAECGTCSIHATGGSVAGAVLREDQSTRLMQTAASRAPLATVLASDLRGARSAHLGTLPCGLPLQVPTIQQRVAEAIEPNPRLRGLPMGPLRPREGPKL